VKPDLFWAVLNDIMFGRICLGLDTINDYESGVSKLVSIDLFYHLFNNKCCAFFNAS